MVSFTNQRNLCIQFIFLNEISKNHMLISKNPLKFSFFPSSDSSSSDDSSYKKDDDPKTSDGAPSPPIRPFPSFPLPTNIDHSAILAARNLPAYFPPAPHPLTSVSTAPGTFPGGSSPTASVEAALRFPDFPFPGGLAAFRKSKFLLNTLGYLHTC